MYYLGIDTSNYTTSVAVIDEDERVIYDGRIILKVEKGGRGLRQSEAVFQHMNNLAPLCREAMNHAGDNKIACVAASSKPRNVEGSYMPVFTSGYNTASIMSSCLGVPLFQCSHQQGHTVAGAWSAGMETGSGFLTYHISGGTTELLKVNDIDAAYEIIGGSEDLNAGQFIDRAGVAMGFSFPCGKEMDKLCSSGDIQPIELPVSVKESFLSLSGPESYVQRLLAKEETVDEAYKTTISKAVFTSIGKALEKTALNACIKHNMKRILFVGGVASNSIIRSMLTNSVSLAKNGIDVIISDSKYSSDNAVGAAIYGRRVYRGNGGLYERG